MKLEALIWDVDGTVAETERDGHRLAFNQAFSECGLPWQWDVAEYGRLLLVTGGFERLLAYMVGRQDAPRDPHAREALARSIHACKNRHYAMLVEQGRLEPRPGVLRLVRQSADAGMLQAVATTTSRMNVEALFPQLFGTHWRKLFHAVICAEEAPRKKPDPMVYHYAIERLGCASSATLAIEDSPAGLVAARTAGVGCLVTRSSYFSDTDTAGAAWACGNLDEPVTVGGVDFPHMDVGALRAIHAHASLPGNGKTPAP